MKQNPMFYICLVCGYPNLEEQPFDGVKFHSTHEICPSCGFHYGYDDLNATGEYPEDFNEWDIIKVYREKWIKNGSKWWSENETLPVNWNPEEQLKNIPEQSLGE